MDTRALRQLDQSIWTNPAHPGSLTRFLTLLCSHSHFVFPPPFLTKPKGNQRTLAETGQPRAQSKQRAKIQSTAHTNKHTKTHWRRSQRLIYHDIHMLHSHKHRSTKAHRDTGNTARHILYLLCQDASMLNMDTHAHAHSHRAAVCLLCSFTALTQLQFAVRQDSQGWSKKCQHILHLTFLLLGSPQRLPPFILKWS